MVIATIGDGLGNQMFHYAVARSLSLKLSTKLLLDLSWFEYSDRPNFRPYKLSAFNIAASEASFLQRLPLSDKVQDLRRKVLGNVSPGYFVEKSMLFDPSVLQLTGNIRTRGLFQSEQYFSMFGDTIRTEFQLRDEMNPELCILRKSMRESQSVSLHVRRGDFATYAHDVYVMPMDYYSRALSYIHEKIDNPIFYIFSDDAVWVKENLMIDNAVLVSEMGTSDCEDLILMSSCRNHVIANSTFSWWGAWLNPNPNKLVVGPQHWFRETSEHDTRDIVPASWTKL